MVIDIEEETKGDAELADSVKVLIFRIPILKFFSTKESQSPGV